MHLQGSLALHQQNLVLYVCISLIYIASYSACLLFIYLPTMLIIDDLIDRKYYVSASICFCSQGVYIVGASQGSVQGRYYIQVKSIVL